MACTRLNPTADSQYALVYRDYVPSTTTDFNNITTMGIYMLGDTTMANGPAEYKWRFLIVLVGGSQTKQQFIVGNMGEIYYRGFSGNPPSWGIWHKVSSTT